MRSDKKSPLKSDKKAPPKVQKKGSIGYNKKSALLEDAITQMNAGKYGRASSALKDLLALDPLNAEARRLFATLHLRLGSLISARTAFESLAREAMERQDYWLAESLLREYLTAGPRYVPFLEMLGRVYEEKGDVMAAVAEYGKAVEVLLEDPDTDKPSHPSDLFARIRSIAPGSPVAFRLAAMFDPVTGQVLQTTPPPAVPAPESEPPQAAEAAAPPWEQVDASPSDPPVTQTPSGSMDARVGEVGRPAIPQPLPVEVEAPVVSTPSGIDQLLVTGTSELTPLEASAPVELTVAPVYAAEETQKIADEQPVMDPLPAMTREVEPASPAAPPESLPATVALVAADADPIAQAPASPAPMPWDQVEDVSVEIPPASASQAATVSGETPAVPSAPEAVPTPAVDAALHAVEAAAQTGSHSIDHALTSPVPMRWDQVAEEAVAIPPPAEHVTEDYVVSETPASEFELPPATAGDAAPQTIEVLSHTGSHPIVEAPTTPVSMPWDQVEENPIPIPPPAAPTPVGVVEVPSESGEQQEQLSSTIETSSPGGEMVTQQPEQPAEPPAASSASEMTSSGLSWEEILAAVAAMQSSPAPAQTLPSAESEQAADRAAMDEPAPAVTAVPDTAEFTTTFIDTPLPEPSLDAGSASSTLSAPMPWEQIEVENLTIPRQEPEPEYGSISQVAAEAGDGGGANQDSTLVLPAVPEAPQPGVQTESLAVAGPTETADESAQEYRLVTPEAERALDNPLPAGTASPVATLAEEPGAVSGPESSTKLVVEESVALPLRLVDSDTPPPQAPVEPASPAVEPVTEFTIAVTGAESSAEASQDGSPVAPSLELSQAQEVITPEESAPADEMTAASAAVSPVEDQTAPPAELPIEPAQVAEVPAEDPAVDMSPVVSLEPVSKEDEPEAVVAPQATAEVFTAEVPAAEIAPVHVESVQESLSAVLEEQSIVVPTDHVSRLVESPPDPEPVQVEPLIEQPMEPAAAVSTEPVAPADSVPSNAAQTAASDGLQILWDDTTSAPVPKPSGGNMLTRWLRKTAEPVPSEESAVAPVTAAPVEPEVPIAPEPTGDAVPTATLAEQPDEPVEQASPVVADEPHHRPKLVQPAGGGLWRRVGEAAASLVGAGVSTTRSLIVLVLGLVGFTLLLIGGAIAAVAVAWLILEEQPSAAYRNMTSVPQETLRDSSKNGYLLLLGLGAAASQDPVQAALDRRVEGADRAFTHTCLTGEGYAREGGHSASAEAGAKWMKAADPALQMRLDATAVALGLSQVEVSLSRYRQWLNKPFEDVGYGQPISPNCGLILQTHRLYLADGFAQDVETGVARLETDFTAWRTVLGQAKSLPVKMLAGVAINDDVAIMGGLLQRADLDDRYVSRIAKIARPLEPSEQSMRWPMQSQFVLATKTLDEAISRDRAETRPFYGAIAAALPLPKQRRFNAYAEYYEAAGKAAADGRYADLPKQAQFAPGPPYGIGDMVVNPIESLVGVDPLPSWETYGGRIMETDARLRLVSLQAWLRRTPPEQDLLTRLAKAGQGLYDPFTGLPMLVNMKKGVLYSVGSDLKDDDAHERLDLVAPIPPVAWAGGKKPADAGKAK